MPGPFDRFTDRAKRILALSQDEAVRFAHDYIGPEHLLLGIVREGEGVGARAFSSLGVELSRLRSHVEFKIGRGTATNPSEIILAPETKQIIDFANEEARQLGDNQVASEHLALGLVRAAPAKVIAALAELNVTLEQLRERTIAARASAPPQPSAPRGVGRSEGVRVDSPAVLKTGQRVRLTSLIPSRAMSVRRDGAITYTLEDDDEFLFIGRDAFGRENPAVRGRVRNSEIERLE